MYKYINKMYLYIERERERRKLLLFYLSGFRGLARSEAKGKKLTKGKFLFLTKQKQDHKTKLDAKLIFFCLFLLCFFLGGFVLPFLSLCTRSSRVLSTPPRALQCEQVWSMREFGGFLSFPGLKKKVCNLFIAAPDGLGFVLFWFDLIFFSFFFLFFLFSHSPDSSFRREFIFV